MCGVSVVRPTGDGPGASPRIMQSSETKGLWASLSRGVEVAAANTSSSELLGIRDGVRQFLQASFGTRYVDIPIAIVPHESSIAPSGLAVTDSSTLALARSRTEEIASDLHGQYQFFVGVDAGLHSLSIDGDQICFVRCWAAVRSQKKETWGASGSLQIPATAEPAKRREGGLLKALTRGGETRRSAVKLAVFHAFSSHFSDLVGGGHGSLPGL